MPLNNKTYSPLGYVTVKAASDLLPNRFIGFDGNPSAAETKSLGISESKWLAGEFASVITIGTAIVETSVAVNAGDKLTSDTDGKAKKSTGSMIINGRSLDTISDAGFVRVLLTT